jgi:hypothetical protein
VTGVLVIVAQWWAPGGVPLVLSGLPVRGRLPGSDGLYVRLCSSYLTAMEHPEESIQPNLSYSRFRSAYASQRRGAGREEVSRAWERYKQLSMRGRPQDASPLCTLPPDLVRMLPTYHRSVLGLLRRTCKRLLCTLKVTMDTLYASDVSLLELERYLTRKVRALFTADTQRLILLRAVVIHEEIATHHS